MIDPVHVAGLDRNDRQARAVLLVADLVAAGKLFGIGRLGDVIRHDGVLRPRRGLADRSGDVLAAGRKLQVGDGWGAGRRESFALLALFPLALLLFAFLPPPADGLDQFALLLLDVSLPLVPALLRRLVAGGALPP